MRGAVVGSGLVHVVLLAVLFMVRTSAPLIVPGPEVVQVALIEPGPIVMRPPEPAPPRPERKAPEIRPTEDSGVKLAPPKPPPRREPTPERPKPEQPAPPVALPFERVGSAGLRGQVAVDARDFEFTYYLLLVRNRVAANWNPPAGLVSGGQPLRVTVYFRVARSGELSGVRLESPSGAEFLDRSALRAVLISDPLPPLPLGYSGSDLGIHFGFEFGGP